MNDTDANKKKVLQISGDLPNPILDIGGYDPKTKYWGHVITLTNYLLALGTVTKQGHKELQSSANQVLKGEIFSKPEHTAVEWAEMVMAINHMLWFLDDVRKTEKSDPLDATIETFRDLYYEWHDKALSVLKGDAKSEYLKITD